MYIQRARKRGKLGNYFYDQRLGVKYRKMGENAREREALYYSMHRSWSTIYYSMHRSCSTILLHAQVMEAVYITPCTGQLYCQETGHFSPTRTMIRKNKYAFVASVSETYTMALKGPSKNNFILRPRSCILVIL